MKSMKRRSFEGGFSLIELLIVMAIIGVLAGIAFQQFQGSVRKANEAAAVAAISTIKLAQAKYQIDHKQYATFPQLFDAGYLDKRFNAETPRDRGYVFEITLVDDGARTSATFKVNANPESASGMGATGKIFYYSEPDAPIFFSDKGPASADDKIL